MIEVTPGDPEFDDLLDHLDGFLSKLDEERLKTLEKEESSLRAFLAYALQTIAHNLGYLVVGVGEFMKDLAALSAEGWRAGAQKARDGALRKRPK